MKMTIDQIVRRTIMEMGFTIHQYVFFYNLALHGLDEMEIDTIGNIKETKLPTSTAHLNMSLGMFIGVRYLNGGHYVHIPENYDLSIERMNTAPVSASGNDFLFTFDDNGYIVVRRTDETKAVRAGMTIGNEYEYNGFNFNIHGEPKGRLFGAAAGNPTQYRYDYATGQLAVSNCSDKDLYITYLDGSSEKTPATAVNPIAVEALTNYIKYKYLEGKRSVLVSDKQFAQREWQNAYRVLRARKFQLSKEDILQSFKTSYGLAIK
jgi:hypothetical protein